jgi:hypothetical protein
MTFDARAIVGKPWSTGERLPVPNMARNPAFSPTGVSLIRDYCSRCRGGVRIVQIGTDWRDGSRNSRRPHSGFSGPVNT